MIVQSKECPGCGYTLMFDAPVSKVEEYRAGALIQTVFPELSPADRERFISGYCGDCWDGLFGGGEDD